MSQRERVKGASAEREVIAILHAHGWLHAERSSNGRVQLGRGDVLNGPAGCHIEVKRQERLNVPAALSQAARDADGLDVPIVVHRPSRHQWMATLPLEDLLPLLALRERS
jgi:hypothetical protein